MPMFTPQSSPSRRPARFGLCALVVAALLSGGAFFYSNWHPTGGVAVADAAPRQAPRKAAPAVKPHPASKAERASVIKTIGAQLHAFNVGNWPEAVKYQSQGLKGNFASPEAFGSMIERVYPAFVRPKKVVYGPAQNVGGHILIEVDLTSHDDSLTKALYVMVKEGGNYRVASVAGGVKAPPAPDSSET